MRYSVLLLIAFLLALQLASDVQIKQIDETTFLIEMSEHIRITTNEFTAVLAEDAVYPVEEGAPNLPFYELRLAVPPKAEIEVQVLSSDTDTKYLSKPIEPVHTIIPDDKTYQFVRIIKNAEYEKSRQNPVEKSELENFRHISYYTLRLNPALYKHESLQLQTISNLKLQIKINGDTSYFNAISDPFSKSLDSFFINPMQAKKWKHVEPVNRSKIPFESSQFWYKVELNSSSHQMVPESSLQQLPAFVNLSQLQLLALFPKNAEEYELKSIPFKIENKALYFSFSQNIPHQAWLTFGRTEEEQSLPKQPLKPLADYQEVYSLREYSYRAEAKNEIECILISPNVYLTQTQEIANFYESFHGMTSLVADQQEIVDTYTDGSANPSALKYFIQDIESENPTTLQYVVLVGSGTVRGHISISLQEWYSLTPKNKILTFDSRDDNFVTLTTSSYPTLPIGRIPAKTVSDLEMYMQRMKSFTETPNHGWWKNKLLLIADDEMKGDGYEGLNSDGLNHSFLIEETAQLLNDNIWIDKIFAFNYEMNQFNQKPGVTEDIIQKVNEGVLTWVYAGHGNPDVMGDEDYFIGTRDIKKLENNEQMGLMIAASCSVSDYVSDNYDSIGEQLLFSESGGSLVTIGASQSCSGGANMDLTQEILQNLYHEYYPVGYALWDAKLNHNISISNSIKYHCLGDPLLPINPPENIGSIEITQPEDNAILQARQTVFAEGQFELGQPIQREAEIRVFDTAIERIYNNYNYVDDDTFYTINYWEYGKEIFRGSSSILETEPDNQYQFGFIVPDDIHSGEKGRIINYVNLEDNHYVSMLSPLEYSNVPLDIQYEGKPQVELMIDSPLFQSGDYVSTSPTIIAAISDSVGINISGEPGRKILIHLDKSNSEADLYDATENFVYDTNSFQKGVLEYQLFDISQGHHTLDLYVYNNFGNVTIESTQFYAQKSGKIAIRDMLPYPNPMQNNGKFTFVITESADVTLEIFTITGKKIRTINQYGLAENYNEIEWNGKDQDGDTLANNTYFYKIKATSLQNRKTTEKIGTFIIYK